MKSNSYTPTEQIWPENKRGKIWGVWMQSLILVTEKRLLKIGMCLFKSLLWKRPLRKNICACVNPHNKFWYVSLQLQRSSFAMSIWKKEHPSALQDCPKILKHVFLESGLRKTARWIPKTVNEAQTYKKKGSSQICTPRIAPLFLICSGCSYYFLISSMTLLNIEARGWSQYHCGLRPANQNRSSHRKLLKWFSLHLAILSW